jgi:hypothetical protein
MCPRHATPPRAHRCDLAQRNQRPTGPRPITHFLRPPTLGTNHLDLTRQTRQTWVAQRAF